MNDGSRVRGYVADDRRARGGSRRRRGLHSRDLALLAQLVEHFHGKEGVIGSSPIEGFTTVLGMEP
jgi:hypothetical protein